MPRRTDLKRIMIIGSESVSVGRDCECDCSGAQGVRALREEGYEVVAVNSSPASLMTDPHPACRAYIEPVDPETVARIIRRERPDALLPAFGGRIALNTALVLARSGVLDECGVEMLGLRADAVEKAANPDLFRRAVRAAGLDVVPDEAMGAGSGWKEFAMELVRDRNDAWVIVCSFEYLDPVERLDFMGGHVGNSISVAPAQTLTGAEYRAMRDAAVVAVRAVGVECGSACVRFGVNPADGGLAVVGMTPRVSRSSALAARATGFPVAGIAARLAVGYTLDELQSGVVRNAPACFEPAVDCCVITIPRSAGENPLRDPDEPAPLTAGAGAIMAIGRTFKEALHKGLRTLEAEEAGPDRDWRGREDLVRALSVPHPGRVFALRRAFLSGFSLEEIHRLSAVEPWFLHQIEQITRMEARFRDFALSSAVIPDNPELGEVLREAKSHGFSDSRLAALWKRPEADIRALRRAVGVAPAYYPVDPCAAEFDSLTPCFYSTYEGGGEVPFEHRRKVIILGGGPRGIGRDLECDYCCCHAVSALREAGVCSIMINPSPETVSTDHGTPDRLYLEPLTFEDVMHVVELERPDGVITQFGGETSLRLAMPLLRAGAPLLGSSPDAVDRVGDGERFRALVRKLDLLQPENCSAASLEEALEAAERIGYPLLIRPDPAGSRVPGGQDMRVAYDHEGLAHALRHAGNQRRFDRPVRIAHFLENAVTVTVDALADGEDVYVAGIMEHIQEAGIHSDDASRVLPPHSLPPAIPEAIDRHVTALARELRVVGLMHVRFAVREGRIHTLEAVLRASRTVPFVSKATGVPLPRLATQVMLGNTLKELDPWSMRRSGSVAVKESMAPFRRFPEVDMPSAPETLVAGEAMGIAPSFAEALFKGRIGAGRLSPGISGIAVRSVQECHASSGRA